MPHSLDHNAPRHKRYRELCEKYSEKAVLTKLDNLADKGYVDYGVNPRGSWLESKGKAVLESR